MCIALSEILKQLANITNAIQIQGETLNAVLTKLGSINFLSDSNDEAHYDFQQNTFPIQSVEKLAEMEVLLNDEHGARKALVNKIYSVINKFTFLTVKYICLKVRKLSGCGGGDAEAALKMMLSFLVDDEILSMHSWKGQGNSKKKKPAFIKYSRIIDALLGLIYLHLI